MVIKALRSILTWVSVVWTLARSACPNSRGPTRPMIKPMMTSTTIISSKVKPRTAAARAVRCDAALDFMGDLMG